VLQKLTPSVFCIAVDYAYFFILQLTVNILELQYVCVFSIFFFFFFEVYFPRPAS
jgi:hypothetical protein